MIWSTPSKRVMATKSPERTSLSSRSTTASLARAYQRYPVTFSMKSMLERTIQGAGLLPKIGPSQGLVLNPPKKSSTVVSRFGSRCYQLSHVRKMCRPHFSIVSISSLRRLRNRTTCPFVPLSQATL